MTLPPHVIEAARKAFIEHSGYEFVEADFAASGIGPSIDAAVQAALQSLWQPIESMPASGVFLAQYQNGDWYRVKRSVASLATGLIFQPLRWMPEPTPPKDVAS